MFGGGDAASGDHDRPRLESPDADVDVETR